MWIIKLNNIINLAAMSIGVVTRLVGLSVKLKYALMGRGQLCFADFSQWRGAADLGSLRSREKSACALGGRQSYVW